MSALGTCSLSLARNPVARVNRLKSIRIGLPSDYRVRMKPTLFYRSPQPRSGP
jgi:hypothetical protein